VNRRLRIAAVALGLVPLLGCGQKGALYLPDRTPEAVKPPPAASAPAEDPARRKTPTPPDPATTQ
jgi:predicted small lipoprotein YifL